MSTSNGSEKVSVLIAEDSRIQAQILAKKLVEAGFEVRVAEDGAVALANIRARRPRIVISDIEMPQMTGYELCSAVKQDPELRTIPFILLSTLSEPEDIIRGLDCGADNYVTKPYDPEFLIARVRSLLETPLGAQEDVEPLEVTLAGHHYKVNSSSQQVLNLLVSTFENAVEKNNELIRTNQELTLAKEQLTVWNDKLEELNGELTEVNKRMTRDLDAAAKVQQSLLPTSTPKTDRASFAWKYLPCDELAGDFLNFFPLDDKHIAAFVVDVSGHGVASSLLSVTIGPATAPARSASFRRSRWRRSSTAGSRWTTRTGCTSRSSTACSTSRRWSSGTSSRDIPGWCSRRRRARRSTSRPTAWRSAGSPTSTARSRRCSCSRATASGCTPTGCRRRWTRTSGSSAIASCWRSSS
jgi:DNA-binding response OmpR family regulator